LSGEERKITLRFSQFVPASPNRIVSSEKVRNGKQGDRQANKYADTIAALEKPERTIDA
jgi:hypothetical protein